MCPQTAACRPAAALPRGFHRLMAAQFTAALADNALLIVAIALLQAQGRPGWWAPLLKFGFTLSYVLLAPGVGVLADAGPKTRLMAWMNALKMLGVLAMLAGLHPVLAYAVVGLGAAAYAPAKYGLVTELVPPEQLVRANGWIEVSVVCAALLGTVLGGGLLGLGLALDAALLILGGVYALAGLLQRGVPDSGARYARTHPHPRRLLRDFRRANRTLWQDRLGGLSLAVTTLFWGVGATLQFAVLRWATEHLGLSLAQAAYLQAVVAVGVVLGATLAGRWVPLAQAPRVMPAGVCLGLLMVLASLVSDWRLGAALLAVVGLVGGLLVVPMNALLQHRGHVRLSAGRSIAVQGFNENLSILLMLAAYAGLLAASIPVTQLMQGLGLAIAALMGALIWRWRRVGAAAA